jgi:hypothetical protein
MKQGAVEMRPVVTQGLSWPVVTQRLNWMNRCSRTKDFLHLV